MKSRLFWLSGQTVGSSGVAATFGTKIGKIIRLVRLIRLLRILKALTKTSKKRARVARAKTQRKAKLSKVMPISPEKPFQAEDKEEQTLGRLKKRRLSSQMEGSLCSPQKKISKTMRDSFCSLPTETSSSINLSGAIILKSPEVLKSPISLWPEASGSRSPSKKLLLCTW